MGDIRWSAAARSVWGKSAAWDDTAFMPLVQHLCDAADVAPYVWRWLPARVRTTIEAGMPEDARDGMVLLSWLAGVHDVGKCSPPFASKLPLQADRMRAAGFGFPGDTSGYGKAPHGLVGHLVLRRWLLQRCDARPAVAISHAVVVGGHHGVPPTWSQLEAADSSSFIGRGLWVEVQDEILNTMASRTGADAHLAAWSRHPLSVEAQALLTGAVIVCDWLASNTEYFPFYDEFDGPRATAAWRDVALPAPWSPSPAPPEANEHFARRFSHLGNHARAVQKAALNAAGAASGVPLIVVEAGMGSGKTEAALLAAEVLAERFDCGGVFFALPTMATSDGMFGRVLDWIESQGEAGPTSTFLAHGKAGLNDEFRGLLSAARMADVHDPGAANLAHSTALVSSWLMGRKRGVLASMVVGTIDQLLFVALQAKHVALRHLAMAGKVVVVDEVHANDDFMRMYLCRTLEWLAAYGVPVILLSATLPSDQRQQFVDAYRRGFGCPPMPIDADAPYPLLTTATVDGVQAQSFESSEQTAQVSVRCLDDHVDALIAQLEEWLVDGGCVAVIRNTVTRAQQTATALREHFGADVELYHSRFLASHRARREGRLRAELGRDVTSRPRRRIVVGTQVLEQSLDVDFDAMVTDLAPVDLVLQRVGRLHRHARSRPPALALPRLLVTGVAEWCTDGPRPVRGSVAVYGLSRLIRSAGALGLTGSGEVVVSIPDDLRRLVQAAYGEQPPVPPPWREQAEQADARRLTEMDRARDRAERFRIAALDDVGGNLVNWLQDSSREAEVSEGSARVRDGEDGVEVIVAMKGVNEVRLLDDDGPYAGRAVSTMGLSVPEPEVARALATATVRLPVPLTRPGAFDDTVDALEQNAFEGFQRSPWLQGQLMLLLDDAHEAGLGDYHLRYDRDDGLVVTRVEETA